MYEFFSENGDEATRRGMDRQSCDSARAEPSLLALGFAALLAKNYAEREQVR